MPATLLHSFIFGAYEVSGYKKLSKSQISTVVGLSFEKRSLESIFTRKIHIFGTQLPQGTQKSHTETAFPDVLKVIIPGHTAVGHNLSIRLLVIQKAAS